MAERIGLITFGGNTAVTLAQARGFFAAEGIEVASTVTPSSTEQMRGLAQGTWQIASTAFDNVLAWSGREGAEIVAVAKAAEAVPLRFYVRPEIKSWEDLHGKVLGADAVDTAFALVLRRMLLDHGLDYARGDYELLAVGATPSRFEAIRGGAAVGGMLNAPWDRLAEEAGLVCMADHYDVVPDYPGGVYAVSRAWAEAHRGRLVGFLRALIAGLRWGRDRANRDEALAALVASGLRPEAAQAALAAMPADGVLEPSRLQVSLDLRVQLGIAPPLGADLTRYYDTSYYEASGDD